MAINDNLALSQPKVNKRTYKEIESKFEIMRDSNLQKYSGKINTFQYAIESSFYLFEVLNTRLLEEYNGNQLIGPKAMIPILFHKNNYYLIAAHKLAGYGLINPCYLILRTVFENIMHIYLLHLTIREARLFYKIQTDQELTPIEKNEYNSYKKLNPSKVREILYVDTKKKKLDNYYSQFSKSVVHPSIIGAWSDFEPNDVSIDDTLTLSVDFSAANIIAIAETFLISSIEKRRMKYTIH